MSGKYYFEIVSPPQLTMLGWLNSDRATMERGGWVFLEPGQDVISLSINIDGPFVGIVPLQYKEQPDTQMKLPF